LNTICFCSHRMLLLINWLPRMDLNHDKVIQSHSIYSDLDSQ
jgi:hypothetical protein